MLHVHSLSEVVSPWCNITGLQPEKQSEKHLFYFILQDMTSDLKLLNTRQDKSEYFPASNLAGLILKRFFYYLKNKNMEERLFFLSYLKTDTSLKVFV